MSLLFPSLPCTSRKPHRSTAPPRSGLEPYNRDKIGIITALRRQSSHASLAPRRWVTYVPASMGALRGLAFAQPCPTYRIAAPLRGWGHVRLVQTLDKFHLPSPPSPPMAGDRCPLRSARVSYGDLTHKFATKHQTDSMSSNQFLTKGVDCIPTTCTTPSSAKSQQPVNQPMGSTKHHQPHRRWCTSNCSQTPYHRALDRSIAPPENKKAISDSPNRSPLARIVSKPSPKCILNTFQGTRPKSVRRKKAQTTGVNVHVS